MTRSQLGKYLVFVMLVLGADLIIAALICGYFMPINYFTAEYDQKRATYEVVAPIWARYVMSFVPVGLALFGLSILFYSWKLFSIREADES